MAVLLFFASPIDKRKIRSFGAAISELSVRIVDSGSNESPQLHSDLLKKLVL